MVYTSHECYKVFCHKNRDKANRILKWLQMLSNKLQRNLNETFYAKMKITEIMKKMKI